MSFKRLLPLIAAIMLIPTSSCDAYKPIPDLKALAKPFKCKEEIGLLEIQTLY